MRRMMISLLLATGSCAVAVNVVFDAEGVAVHGGLCAAHAGERPVDLVVPAGL